MNKIVSVVAALVLASFSCQSTATKDTTSQNDSAKKVAMETTATTANTSVLKLVKHDVVDRKGTGMVASAYLLPDGWTAQDRLYWEYRDPTVPIRYKGLLQSADKQLAIQSYPDVRASWYTGPSGTQGYRPPSDIISGLKDLIKAERRGKNIQWVNQKILANHPQSGYQQGAQVRGGSQAGIVKIAYDEAGQLYEEEFYGQLDITDLVTPSAMGNMESIIWGAGSLYSVKAPKGKLDDCRKIAQTVKASARLTKPFYNKLAQVIQLLSNQVYQQIYQAGQLSRIISQTNDQMLANIDASYQQTQQAYDRINNNFSDYMRGVDRYNDGGSEIQLPAGYDHAWVNDRGEYLLTNTTGYDPGHAFNGNWKELNKQ